MKTLPAPLGPPAHVAPYVEVLGEALATRFFLAFGGSELYLPRRPERSMVVELTGQDKAAMLCERLGPGIVRVPIPKPWLAAVLERDGQSKAAIARLLHVDQTTVRRWAARARDRNQLSLFDL